MAQRVEHNPLHDAYAAILTQGLDGAGQALRILVDEASKIERAQYLNAGPHERSADRMDYANGFKPKTVMTRMGEITFAIPQVRGGGFYPSALEKGSRTDQALNLMMAEMYVQGVSTRKVIEVLQRLVGPEVSISSTQVSRATLPSVPWQRCQFHLQQNAQSHITRIDQRESAGRRIRAIFNAPDRAEAEHLLKQAIEAWGTDAPKLAAWGEANLQDGFTVFNFPAAHRVRLRTTNGLERVNREIKRRTRVASIFPNAPSCLRLVSALLAETDEDWLEGKIYLNLKR